MQLVFSIFRFTVPLTVYCVLSDTHMYILLRFFLNKICEESADQPVTLKRSKYSQRANQLWKQTEYLTGGNTVFIQLLMSVSLAFNAHLGFPSANWDLHENKKILSLSLFLYIERARSRLFCKQLEIKLRIPKRLFLKVKTDVDL